MLSKHSKLTLESLRVQSFITCLNAEKKRLIKGRSLPSQNGPTMEKCTTSPTTGS